MPMIFALSFRAVHATIDAMPCHDAIADAALPLMLLFSLLTFTPYAR